MTHNNFNAFYHAFINNGKRNTDISNEVDNVIEQTFKQYINATLDQNFHFKLEDIKFALETRYSSNLNIKLLNDLLLITDKNNNIVIKFCDTGVLCPEFIGQMRREWFDTDLYEKIKWRVMLNESNIFTDTYISSQVGYICFNGIDDVYILIWENDPVMGLVKTISEVFPHVEST